MKLMYRLTSVLAGLGLVLGFFELTSTVTQDFGNNFYRVRRNQIIRVGDPATELILFDEFQELDRLVLMTPDQQLCRDVYSLVHILDYAWLPQNSDAACAEYSSDDFRYYLASGDLVFYRGDMQAALQLWQRGMLVGFGFSPEEVERLQMIAVEDALREYGSRPIEWENMAGRSYFLRATFYLLHFSETISNDPFWSGMIETESGRRHLNNSEKTLALLTEAIRQAPDDWRLRVILGDAYARVGYPNEARKEWEYAISLRPENAAIAQRLDSTDTFRYISSLYYERQP